MGTKIEKLDRTTPVTAVGCVGFWLRSRLSLCSMVEGVVPSSAAMLLCMRPCARRISSRSTVNGVQEKLDMYARPKRFRSQDRTRCYLNIGQAEAA